MKKFIFLILLLPIFTRGQEADSAAPQVDSSVTYGHFAIKNVAFTFKTIKGRFGDEEDTTIHFVLLKNNKPLLKHTLWEEEGDCNSMDIEIGDYDVTDSSIIFYSYYAWIGGCCGLPYGVREQIYKVNDKGNLYLDQSEIYLERYKDKPSEMDSVYREKWISETEKNYHAKFVLGKKAERLMKRVKLRLAKQISDATDSWPTDYLGKNLGYRR